MALPLVAFIGIACIIAAICILCSMYMSNSVNSLSSIRFPNLSFDFTPLVSFMLITATITIGTTWRAAVSVEKKYKAGMKRLAIRIALAASTLYRDEEVYRLDMLISGGIYTKLKFNGFSTTFIYNDPNDSTAWKHDKRYKFGTTKMIYGPLRYSGTIIGSLLGTAVSYTAILQNLNMYESRIIEKRYIYAYYLRYFTYPPQNSKLG